MYVQSELTRGLKAAAVVLLSFLAVACSGEGDSYNDEVRIGKQTEEIESEPVEIRMPVDDNGAATSSSAARPQQEAPQLPGIEDPLPRVPAPMEEDPMPQETLANSTPSAPESQSPQEPADQPVELPEN